VTATVVGTASDSW